MLLVKETVREMWGWTPIEQFWQDLGYARRALAGTPAFTIAAVLTLGLGIGANTAMFSVVRAVVLRPLPFADPDRLVQIDELDLRGAAARRSSVSWPNFLDWQQRTQTLESMAAYHQLELHGHRPGAVAACARARWSRRPSSRPSAWRRPSAAGSAPPTTASGPTSSSSATNSAADILGARADPVGTGLTVNGRQFTIVGVTPPGFVFPVASPAPQLWVTMAEDARVEAAGRHADHRAARRALSSRSWAAFAPASPSTRRRPSSAAWQRRWPASTPTTTRYRGATVTPQLDALIGEARRPLLLLLAAVGCVLLIACVNLANLMTARGVGPPGRAGPPRRLGRVALAPGPAAPRRGGRSGGGLGDVRAGAGVGLDGAAGAHGPGATSAASMPCRSMPACWPSPRPSPSSVPGSSAWRRRSAPRGGRCATT